MNNKGEMNLQSFVGLGLLFLVGLMVYQSGGFQAITGGEAPVSQPITVEVEGACGVDSTTLTAHMVKKYDEGTTMGAENVTIVLNGAEKITKLHGASTTVSPGDKVALYYGFYSATYYTTYATGTIPCKGALLTSDSVFTPTDAYKLCQMEAATSGLFTVVNADGTSTNPGTAQAFGVGQTKKLSVTINPTYEDCWGGANGAVLSCQYNTTAMSSKDPVRVTKNGADLTIVTSPSNTLWAPYNTVASKVSFDLGKIDGKALSEVKLEVIMKASETNEPNVGAAASMGGGINCTVFDTDYFKTDDGQFKIGIEDSDDNSNVGKTETDSANGFGIKIS